MRKRAPAVYEGELQQLWSGSRRESDASDSQSPNLLPIHASTRAARTRVSRDFGCSRRNRAFA